MIHARQKSDSNNKTYNNTCGDWSTIVSNHFLEMEFFTDKMMKIYKLKRLEKYSLPLDNSTEIFEKFLNFC